MINVHEKTLAAEDYNCVTFSGVLCKGALCGGFLLLLSGFVGGTATLYNIDVQHQRAIVLKSVTRMCFTQRIHVHSLTVRDWEEDNNTVRDTGQAPLFGTQSRTPLSGTQSRTPLLGTQSRTPLFAIYLPRYTSLLVGVQPPYYASLSTWWCTASLLCLPV